MNLIVSEKETNPLSSLNNWQSIRFFKLNFHNDIALAAQHTALPRVSFAEPVPNVTVAVGRDAALSCVVDNLGSHRVSYVQSFDNRIIYNPIVFQRWHGSIWIAKWFWLFIVKLWLVLVASAFRTIINALGICISAESSKKTPDVTCVKLIRSRWSVKWDTFTLSVSSSN